ncbi:MAG TPA: bifunctional phosphopantothenoylcysteine decarboxylase/phosphopantothenate--cysteine ligase CoaBC [Candidatus Desulfaltia sp.]|nr:bifunctional phosphopantothenoylcysteine decarboxylase/phosphopantothenate--cysteine ligase CoaBC [Candidatus Desulfaltia sp.]
MHKIALGVSSSVSIYKACEVLRGFQKKGIAVQVIMTPNAAKLVSPQLFSALSGREAAVDLFGEGDTDRIAHISLAEEISLLVIAPATANIIAKLAGGVADDFLSTFYLAVRCPVLIAPAMNEAMYLHPQTQSNIRKLQAAGVEFILPGKGYLACREEGWGRLPAPERIVECGLQLLERSESLKGRTILVTAGPTREPLDPVRYLSNRSSGRMGYELAGEALRRGARVIIVSGPTSLFPPPGAEMRAVETAAEMAREVKKNFAWADVLIMAAAVADFRSAGRSQKKIKKREAPPVLRLVPTEDILATLGRDGGRAKRIIVGFAAETEDVAANALKKLRAKKLDLIVANDVSRKDIGFNSEDNQVMIIDRKGTAVESDKASKREISRLIMDRIEVLLDRKK